MAATITQDSTHVIFTNDQVSFKLAKAGAASDFLSINGSPNLIARPMAFAAFDVGSITTAADSVRYTPTSDAGGRLRFGFPANFRMTLECRAHDTHFSFELINLSGNLASSVTSILIAQLRIDGDDHSNFAGVIYRDDFAVSELALEIETRVISTPTRLHSVSFMELPAAIGEPNRLPHLKVALLAGLKNQWPSLVEDVEQVQRLPHPTIESIWAKQHPDLESSYLLVDITESNTAAVIDFALRGKFKYIIPYVLTWAQSLGTYAVNSNSYPSGFAGLRSVVQQVHTQGLKFGFHILTCLISRNDPYVQPAPDPRLAKESPLPLAERINESTDSIPTTGSLTAYEGYFDLGERDIIIDNEIMTILSIEANGFRAKRGQYGTMRDIHRAGAIIHHLPEDEGKYFPDLRSNLLAEIANNFASTYNHLEIQGDFVYLDGSESLARILPSAPWFSSTLISDTFFRRLSGNVFLEGSGTDQNYQWHPLSRGASGDFAAIGVEAYMDFEKIGRFGERYNKAFFSQELGWIGMLAKVARENGVEESFSSTTLEEMEYQMNRALGHGLPIGLETHHEDLLANGLTGAILDLIAKYEENRLINYFPDSVLEKLKFPDEAFLERFRLDRDLYHLVQNAQQVYGFQRRVYVEHIVMDPRGETWVFENPFADQPLKLKISALPSHEGYEGRNLELANALLEGFQAPEEGRGVNCTVMNGRITATFNRPPGSNAPERGTCQIRRILPGSEDLNLSNNKVIGLSVTGDARGEVVSIELTDDRDVRRQYQFPIDFRDTDADGTPRPRTVILSMPETRELFKYSPSPRGVPFFIKLSLRPFRYKAIKEVTILIKNIPEGSVEFSLGAIKALRQHHPTLSSPACGINGRVIRFPTTLRPRETRTIDGKDLNFEPWEYLVFNGTRFIKYDGNNVDLDSGVALDEAPIVRHGRNTIAYRHEGTNQALVTIMMEDRPSFQGDRFISFNSFDFIALSGALKLGKEQGEDRLRVTSIQSGDLQWIALELTLPPGITMKQIAVHYKLSHVGSHISQVRLTKPTTPGESIILHDDEIEMTNTNAAAYHSHVNDLQPNGPITLVLGLRFSDPTDTIEIGEIRILVKEI